MSAPVPWRPLRKAVLRAPTTPVETAEDIARFGYHRALDLSAARVQHAVYADVLIEAGVDVHFHDAPLRGLADAIYVCDPILMVPGGAVQLRMGKALRSAESPALAAFVADMGVPLVGAIEAPGTVEGGDCLWLDDETLAVGLGYRTNRAGIEQLKALVAPVQVLVFHLPYYGGPAECMHLQSLMSFVDSKQVVIHRPLCPVVLIQELDERGIAGIEAEPSEFDSLATNILCLEPGRVVMAAGSPKTVERMSHAGIDVTTVEAPDLMWNGSGGPTCLTLPLMRG